MAGDSITRVDTAVEGSKTLNRVDAAQRVAPAKGNQLPGDGKNAPRAAERLMSVEDAVAQLNEYMQSIRREIHFMIDGNSERPIIRVIDVQTGDTIRQIPPEEILQIARHLDSKGLHLFDNQI
ncbi:MAG: flagellar protein FlaG [Gammaproteobacteria bacterium]|nr:flagellar protein FlaG [Gammaproteobacteria bacterium]